MRIEYYHWLLAIGSTLGIAALIVAFGQSPSEPEAFNRAVWLAGSLGVAALLLVAIGVLLRLRRENGSLGTSDDRSRSS
jgi:hypothetical protein